MDDRDQILKALGDGKSTPPPTRMPEFVSQGGDAAESFLASFEALAGRIVTDLSEFSGRSQWVDADFGYGLVSNAASVWDAEVGYARALAAVVETGSLLFASGPAGARLTTLAPPISIVALRRSTIVRSLSEALDIASEIPTANLVLVTGPSRTADIEGILVRGVHGPGELYVFLED
jgi:L-lactate dehydrogenase complex protein LldG